MGQASPVLIGGVVEFLYTTCTRPTDSLCEDAVGLPETSYFFEVARVLSAQQGAGHTVSSRKQTLPFRSDGCNFHHAPTAQRCGN